MPRAMRRWLAIAGVALAAAGCSGGGGGSSDGPSAPASGFSERTFVIPSAHTGATYSVTVFTPAGYATSTAAKPVVYALDRELQYVQVQNAVVGYNLDAIIVAISNINGDRRFVDFELPGAEAYFRFLTLEVIPFVEAQYRVDRTRRTLVGYSLSGLMATLAIFLEQPSTRYFSSAVVTDASFQFHIEQTLALEQRMFDTSRNLPLSLHMCYTSSAAPYSQVPERIATHGYQGLRMTHHFYGLSHAAVLVPCIDDGLRFVFGRT